MACKEKEDVEEQDWREMKRSLRRTGGSGHAANALSVSIHKINDALTIFPPLSDLTSPTIMHVHSLSVGVLYT